MPKIRYDAMKPWNFDYNGAAIYKLTDQHGRVYIGQARRLQNRLHQHRQEMNRIKRGSEETSEGEKIAEAVRSGSVFEASILEKIHWTEATVNNLRERECYWLDVYGGMGSTLNSGYVFAPAPHVEQYNTEIIFYAEVNDPEIIAAIEAAQDKDELFKEAIRKMIGGGK